jgi:isoleucyl-tRNA synthetase
MVMEVGRGLEAYEMQEAISPIIDFIDSLNNWYIRRSRRRFWKSENDSDKTEAYNTLHHVLRRLVLVAAPFMPFITEAIYQNLRSPSDPDSVHLCRWPEYDERFRNPELERDMASVRHAVSMGRALRVTNDLKTRQPLASVQIVTKIAEEKKVLSGMEDILREELNVKSILFKDNEEDLVEYSIKANFRVLGKILGKEMKAAAAILEALDPASVSSIVAGFSIFIDVSGQKISIDQNSVEIRRTEKPGLKVLNEGTLTLALDTVVTPSLLREGYVRDLIRGVQNLRKESGLDVTDRINLIIAGDIELKKALDDFGDFVAGETLADSITWKEGRDENVSLVEAGEKTWYISLSRA